MKKIFNSKFLLTLIILIAAFLRFYQISNNPPSLTWDEAAWGYNAYSLGQDGRDEFGRFLPYDYLESFGDFKPPVYAYLDIIPIKIFGLNEFGVRFPSALFGALTVLVTYFLVLRIFRDPKSSIINHKLRLAALLSALFLAISPWHILLSRAAFEANIATFFLAVGIWMFLAGVQDRKWFLLFSVVSFSLSLYTFNTSRIVAPLLVILLILVFRKKLWEIKKQTIISAVLGFLIILPIVPFLLSPQAQLRFKEVNIFSNIEIVKTANQEIANDNNAYWSKLIHNRRVLYGIEYVKHYFDNLSPGFLFIKGDQNPKFSTREVGQMFIWDIPFFILGILFLIKKKEGAWWIIPSWILIGIIPAATARETPHALRIETTLPMFQILTAYGFTIVALSIKKHILSAKAKYLIFATLFVILFFNFIYFAHNYLSHYKTQFSSEWQYGYKESIEYVNQVEKNYDQIEVTNSLGRPYIYYLFYGRTDPKFFRDTARIHRDPFGFVSVLGFGKYVFPSEEFNPGKMPGKTLVITTPYNLPSGIKVLKTFYLLNGEPALVAYE
jgi:4-amino-4-deoxy-L-arabinose transferase-like glycosyltransferase